MGTNRLITNIVRRPTPSFLCLTESNMLGMFFLSCSFKQSRLLGLWQLSHANKVKHFMYTVFPNTNPTGRVPSSASLIKIFNKQKYKQQKVFTTVCRTSFVSITLHQLQTFLACQGAISAQIGQFVVSCRWSPGNLGLTLLDHPLPEWPMAGFQTLLSSISLSRK